MDSLCAPDCSLFLMFYGFLVPRASEPSLRRGFGCILNDKWRETLLCLLIRPQSRKVAFSASSRRIGSNLFCGSINLVMTRSRFRKAVQI